MDAITVVITFINLYHCSDSMGLDFVNPHVTKILLAVQDGDSINRIAQKAGGSYGWTHRWIERLEELGVIERDDGVYVADTEFQEAFEGVAQTVLSREMALEDAYALPNFSGLDYRYAQTDAVYLWTKGGYQIGRNRDDYPIFLDVVDNDVEAWEAFFDDFGADYRIGERDPDGDGIYFVMFPQDEIDYEWVEHAAVPPLQETVDWAQQYEANFQPALEMLAEMYDLELDVTYRERKTI